MENVCNAKSTFVIGTKGDQARSNARENLAFFASEKNMASVFLSGEKEPDKTFERLLQNVPTTIVQCGIILVQFGITPVVQFGITTHLVRKFGMLVIKQWN